MNSIHLEKSWERHLCNEFSKEYFIRLKKYIHTEYKNGAVFPLQKNIFHALHSCPIEKVKVVVLGQDPYHGEKQADGLSFSVGEGVVIPPSLQNIYTEIKNDIGMVVHDTGNLDAWAKQGVLLLNATLTVRNGKAGSHQGQGWEEFTDAIVRKLSKEREGIVFMLWGAYAQKKGKNIDTKKHLILQAPHPSPLSAYRGFFGCKHFSKTNSYLQKYGGKKIEW